MEHNFQIELNFPAVEITECDSSLVSKALNGALITELKTTAGGDILVELPTGKDVADMQPSLDEIEKFPGLQRLLQSLALVSSVDFSAPDTVSQRILFAGVPIVH